MQGFLSRTINKPPHMYYAVNSQLFMQGRKADRDSPNERMIQKESLRFALTLALSSDAYDIWGIFNVFSMRNSDLGQKHL